MPRPTAGAMLGREHGRLPFAAQVLERLGGVELALDLRALIGRQFAGRRRAGRERDAVLRERGGLDQTLVAAIAFSTFGWATWLSAWRRLPA